MPLWIARDANLEPRTGGNVIFANTRDQVDAVAKSAWVLFELLAHSAGWIAAQRDQVANARVPEILRDVQDFFFGCTHAGQMRGWR